MDGRRPADPFLWDEDVVISELSALPRPCSHNVEELALRVRDNGIDGYTLLTHDFMGGAFNMDLRNELYQSLNVKLLKHKNALGEAIMVLRRRSPGFQNWTLDNLDVTGNEKKASGGRAQESTMSVRLTPQSERVHLLPTSLASGDTKISTPIASKSEVADPCISENHSLEEHHNEEPITNNKKIEISTTSSGVKSKSPARQLKRKRIAPQLLQDKPVNLLPIPLATEADSLSQNHEVAMMEKNYLAKNDGSEDELAYLGKGIIDRRDVESTLTTLMGQLYGDGDAISTPVPTKFPPGKRLVVNKIMRRLLTKNARIMQAMDSGLEMAEAAGSYSSGDKILDLDDLPDELDRETLEEMEEERIEGNRRLEAGRSRLVAPSRVREILDEELLNMKNSWITRKLPKHKRKAHVLWTNALRRGKKSELFTKAIQDVKRFNDRIKKLETEIMGQKWSKEREIRLQASCMEQSVEDRLYHSWLADVLGSRFEPPKASTQSKQPTRHEPRIQHVSTDEELLTSSDEDGFIVDDDATHEVTSVVGPPQLPEVTSQDDPIELHDVASQVGSTRPSSAIRIKGSQSPDGNTDSPIYIDLTQIDSSGACTPTEQPAATRVHLDLSEQHKNDEGVATQQVQPSSAMQMHALSWHVKYHDVKQIASYPPAHWVKQRDRYALVITLLWRLGHPRRSAVLKHVQETSVDESFRLTIARHIAEPLRDLKRLVEPSQDTLAFDVSRLFLCFLMVKKLKESRLADLKPASMERLRSQQDGNSWAVWHEFLVQMAPLFPQDKHIWRDPDTSDDEMIDDVDVEAGGGTNKKTPRRATPREIIRNKDAVDLRERERRRAEEQQARVLRFRANLDKGTIESGDKTRLIINESKQDEQPFVYVNEEIGKRIKEHQIDGVRFMWNQLVQDPTLRQGCLLAHTMGLGKTMQVITLLVAIQESSRSSDPSVVSQIPEELRKSKTLVVCPGGLVDNWIDELLIWDANNVLGGPFSIDSYLSEEGRRAKSKEWSQNGGVLVIGYQILKQMSDKEEMSYFDEPNLVIADEAHAFRNPHTQIHEMCSRFRTKSRIALTGSPLANSIEEYYSMINWVAPNFLGPLSEFRQIYANPIQQGLNNDSQSFQKRKALKMLQALKQTVAPKVHRATTKTCLEKDLPPKREFVLCVKPTPLQIKIYNLFLAAIRGTFSQDEEGGRGSMFGNLNILLLLCNHPAVFGRKARGANNISASNSGSTWLPQSIHDQVLELLSAESNEPSASTKVKLLIQILDCAREKGDKVLVFSQSLTTLDYLASLFKQQKRRFSRLDGGTPVRKRQEHIKSFNTNDSEFYLISIKAGGVGLNIQGANRVVIFDLQWNPVHEQQAVGRAYRIGQSKPVTVYYFVTAGTFEEDLHAQAVFKSQLAFRVVDKKNPVSWGSRQTGLMHDVVDTDQKSLTGHFGKDSILDQIILKWGNTGNIREVIPTDTFEEEDEKAPLSVEEQREADDMVRLYQLRYSNQEDPQRQKNGKENQPFQKPPCSTPHSISVPSRTGIIPLSKHSLPSVGSAPLASGSDNGVPAGHTLPSLRTPPVPPVVAIGVNSNTPNVSPPEDVSRNPAQQGQKLMPMRGAQTFFGNAPKTILEHGAAAQLNQTLPTNNTAETHVDPNPFFSVIKNPQREEFRERITEGCERVFQGQSAKQKLVPFLDHIVNSIDRSRQSLKRGFLPDNHHWRVLTDFIGNDRFVLALITGIFTPEFLAIADTEELQRRVAALEGLANKELRAKIEETKKMHNIPSLTLDGHILDD